MRLNLRNLLTRRIPAAGPLVAACLLVAGCGGTSHTATATQTTSTQTSAASTSTASSSTAASAPPASGTTLAAALVKSLATSQPQLKHVKAQCPGGANKGYPVKCHFTATQTASGKTIKFAGTITVTGQSGGSYEFGLNYAPTH